MNSAMLSQVMLNPTAGMQERARQAETVAEGPSFSRYLEKKAAAESERKNQLGTTADAKEAEEAITARERAERQEDAAATRDAAAFLALLLTQLKDMARSGADGEGAFSLQSVDEGLFPHLAAAMGLSEADMSSFLRRISEMSDNREMENFFTMLISRLREMVIEKPVTVAETELPLLQTLLSQMGARMDEIAAMTEPSVTGDNKLDLVELVADLKGLTADGEAVLSDWDVEQLQNMLAEAGLDREQVSGIFQGLAADLTDDGALTLSLEKLTSLLEKAIEAARQNRPQVDAPSFLSKLGLILDQTAADGASPNWRPLVQQSLQAIYEQLQKIADLARVTVERRDVIAGRQEYLDQLTAMFSDRDDAGQAGFSVVADGDAPDAAGMLKVVEGLLVGGDTETRPEDGDGFLQAGLEGADAKTFVAAEALSAKNMAQPGARPSPAAMQQHIFDQLAKGVFRGLQNGEHHLVLKLHPPELGEVKVDLLVRDDQLSVSFSMENTRVKEALENSMQQFRDNLEQRGFVLEHCFVSVGDDGGPQENWRRFEEALSGKDYRLRRIVELPGEMLYQRNATPTASGGGVSLFV